MNSLTYLNDVLEELKEDVKNPRFISLDHFSKSLGNYESIRVKLNWKKNLSSVEKVRV